MAMAPVTAGASSTWPTYHGDNGRSGNASGEPSLFPTLQHWTSPDLDGQIYAEPLLVAGRVVVATENDSLYGLDPRTGHVVWQTHVGTPVPLANLPCGNIDPLGITGTPAEDPATGTVYAVAEVTGPAHLLVAVDAATGAVRFTRPFDPPGMSPDVQQQRASVLVANGRVYALYGGLDGDCGNYHGWVVGSNLDGSGSLIWYQTPGSEDGMWAPGGAAIDGAGNLLVATGNGSSTTTYDHGDSVIRLSPTLAEEDHFAPANWAADNGSDSDLGSDGPLPVAAGQLVFQVGKEQTGYLLHEAALGGIGGQAFEAQVCFSIGESAYVDPYIYVPCNGSLQALRLNAAGPSFSPAWSVAGGFFGPPIVAGGAVWSVDQDGRLVGVDPASGAIRFDQNIGAVTHFTTPTAAGGLLLVAATTHIVAFTGPGGADCVAPSSSGPGYWLGASDGGIFTCGRAAFYGSAGAILLNRPIVGMAATPDGRGYWLVASDGGIFTYGDAHFYGSTGSLALNRPIVGMAATPDGRGYWLVASDGGIFTFGDAHFYGSTGSLALNRPIVGMAATPDGRGYWLVASDGGIFTFGDAHFYGSTGSLALNRPVVGMARTADGQGYWLVASDGGIFTFGDAHFYGSAGAIPLNRPIVGMATTADGHGYWLVATDGGIFTYGDAPFAGSTGSLSLNRPVVGMAPASG
jgi:hypothetical protein